MTAVVVDAGVRVAAADATDRLSERSRVFLGTVVDRVIPIELPDSAELEVACAMACRLRDAERARRLASGPVASPPLTLHGMHGPALRQAIETGAPALSRRAPDGGSTSTSVRSADPTSS